jgi:hypothetical protein
MGGMVAQELAVLLAGRCRLISLSLSVTCRGLRPSAGPLAPLMHPRLLAPLLAWWFRGAAERKARLIIWKVVGRGGFPGTPAALSRLRRDAPGPAAPAKAVGLAAAARRYWAAQYP